MRLTAGYPEELKADPAYKKLAQNEEDGRHQIHKTTP
jgi:hypothetical protein